MVLRIVSARRTTADPSTAVDAATSAQDDSSFMVLALTTPCLFGFLNCLAQVYMSPGPGNARQALAVS